ncbi:MAG TPA: response regulator [Candidatus Avacidaminococcus intestinavium]|uniref:Response regulator n=1 Tax=Candidatus Avacidaminococcus intestinavium TaxID=2840684 RepID=A0A9D1MQ42_9FIRM|nr:response regulator [Candidatus Avacidaminococcus intestinavium]
MEKLRIIIADDETIIRMDIKEMLVEAGHTVIAEAQDGEEAVRLAEELKPDLIIMDVKMPKVDGITAARLINNKQLAPVLLLTAYSQTELIEQAKNSGVLAYLVKPIREEQLFPAIEIARSRFTEIKTLGEELDLLKESLETRKLLDRAKGILMTAHNLTEVEAYRKMQQYSMNQRISLKELAESIIRAADKKK